MIRFSTLVCVALVFLTAVPAQAQYGGSQSPVGIPMFHFKDGSSHWAGKAFAIKWFGRRNLLLCPLHCLSLSAEVDARTIPARISSVEVLDLQGKDVVTTATRALLNHGASVAKRTGSLGTDMMAFELPSHTNLPVLGLSAHLAPVKTRVWVLSKTEGSTSVQADRYPGTVTFSADAGLSVRLDRPLDAPGSSGAPVVDANNQLVGMMVGTQSDDRLVIGAIPSTTIYKRLYLEVGR